jgi:aspartate/methionine/tyrosine aminotransferase
VTARAFGQEAVIVNSFSKYYSMTGWRLGWMLVPPDLARSVECLAQNFYISPPALSQLAALPVFGCRAELDGHVARYRANRDLLIHALSAAGLTRFAPAEGAFYLYVDISSLTRDSEGFCRRLLAETGVAVTPGLDFDPIHGGGWVRFSFAGSTDDITEAGRRLEEWLPRQLHLDREQA